MFPVTSPTSTLSLKIGRNKSYETYCLEGIIVVTSKGVVCCSWDLAARHSATKNRVVPSIRHLLVWAYIPVHLRP